MATRVVYDFEAGSNNIASAQAIWEAYLATPTGFAPRQRIYAKGLDNPSRVLLATRPSATAIAEQIPTASAQKKAALIKEFLRCSVAILLLGPTTTVGTELQRKILYMHTRAHFLGAGHATALLQEAQILKAVGNDVGLVVDAAACRTWVSSLVLLRNWFGCSQDIWSCDLPRPGETPSSSSHQLMFHWKPATSGEEHVQFVRVAAEKQLARRSKRAKEYGAELLEVVKTLERKLGR